MDNKEVILSVCVTFCNQERYIRSALDGIIKQNVGFDYEILIGLDGKKEESLEIIKEYTDKYDFIKVYESFCSDWNCINIEKASANRLNLLKHAKGKYFCILDGDDCYGDEEQFQMQVDALQKNADCIGCAVGQIFVYPTYEKNLLYPSPTFYTLKSYIKSNRYIHNGAIMFRNIFKYNFPKGFPEKIVNDTTMTMYMMKFGKVAYIPLASYRYTISDTGIYQGVDDFIKKLYAVLDAEVNLQYMSICRKYLLKRYAARFVELYHNRREYILYNSEIDKILKFAKENDCRLLRAVLSYGRSRNWLGRLWWSLLGKLILITKGYSGGNK